MSDCRYCDLRVLEDSEGRGSPHKHVCPGLEVERLEAELEQARAALTRIVEVSPGNGEDCAYAIAREALND